MLVYANLGDYINDRPAQGDPIRLKGSDRPFLVLELGEELTKAYPFLMERQPNIYELGFPWVQVKVWEDQGSLSQIVNIETKKGTSLTIHLSDEVLDETQISSDENKLKHLRQDKRLDQRFDRTTADTIAIFIGLFNALLGQGNHRSESEFFLVCLPGIFRELSREDARLPLVLALNERYELRHKLELIAPKLRSQLNRTAEMIPLGRIQEMDAYCLRDYVRRPGHNAIEKAGAKQTLMGIKRYQNFNTPENRFLIFFANILHLECLEYESRSKAKELKRAIDRFRQEPAVQTIPHVSIFTGNPNYVLQQNPIYRSFYQAYLDYLKRRTEKENIWGFRQALLVDTVLILLLAALLNFEGSFVETTASISVSSIPSYGKYLTPKILPTIHCILQTMAVSFMVSQPSDPKLGDLDLSIRVQSLTKDIENSYQLKFWIFWYKPTPKVLEQVYLNCSKDTISFYFYENPSDMMKDPGDPMVVNLFKLPHPIDASLDKGIDFLTNLLCKYLGGLVS